MIHKKLSRFGTQLFITLFVTVLMVQPALAAEIYLPLIMVGSAPVEEVTQSEQAMVKQENITPQENDVVAQTQAVAMADQSELPSTILSDDSADDAVDQEAEVSVDGSSQTRNLRLAAKATHSTASILEKPRFKRIKSAAIAIVAMLIFIGKGMMGGSRKRREVVTHERS